MSSTDGMDAKVISDLAHSIEVDAYTFEQQAFLKSIVIRLGRTTATAAQAEPVAWHSMKDSFDYGLWLAHVMDAADAAGINNVKLSELTGVGTTTLSRMQDGRRPDAASLAALSAWAGINPASYVRGVAPVPVKPAVEVVAQCVIYLDTDPIDVAQFYRAKGFQHLPPTPTMTGAEIRACGWKKNNYQMYIDVTPMQPIGDTEAVALENGMKFFCIPEANW